MLLEDFQYCIVAYDDWFVPELLDLIAAFYKEFEPWEHEAIIAAEAYYAENFICPN